MRDFLDLETQPGITQFVPLPILQATRAHLIHSTRGLAPPEHPPLQFVGAPLTAKQFGADWVPVKSSAEYRVLLPRVSDRSQFLPNYVQRLAPCTFPIVHPAQVYVSTVALAARKTLIKYHIDVASNGEESEETLHALLQISLSTLLIGCREKILSNLAAQVGSIAIGEDLPTTLTLDMLTLDPTIPDFLPVWQHNVRDPFYKQMASLPPILRDADRWVRSWLDSILPAGKLNPAEWGTKALMWGERAVQTRKQLAR